MASNSACARAESVASEMGLFAPAFLGQGEKLWRFRGGTRTLWDTSTAPRKMDETDDEDELQFMASRFFSGKTSMKKYSKPEFFGRKAEEQPKWDDEDDLVPEPKKAKTQTTAEKGTARLVCASLKTIDAEVTRLTDQDLNVRVFALNRVRSSAAQTIHLCERKDAQDAANFDVKEQERKAGVAAARVGHWDDPGFCELQGIAAGSFEVADFLVESERNAAIVYSTQLGDAAKLLACCASKALKSQLKTVMSGTSVPRPKSAALKAIADRFKSWSHVTAASEIVTFIPQIEREERDGN